MKSLSTSNTMHMCKYHTKSDFLAIFSRFHMETLGNQSRETNISQHNYVCIQHVNTTYLSGPDTLFTFSVVLTSIKQHNKKYKTEKKLKTHTMHA